MLRAAKFETNGRGAALVGQGIAHDEPFEKSISRKHEITKTRKKQEPIIDITSFRNFVLSCFRD